MAPPLAHPGAVSTRVKAKTPDSLLPGARDFEVRHPASRFFHWVHRRGGRAALEVVSAGLPRNNLSAREREGCSLKNQFPNVSGTAVARTGRLCAFWPSRNGWPAGPPHRRRSASRRTSVLRLACVSAAAGQSHRRIQPGNVNGMNHKERKEHKEWDLPKPGCSPNG